MFEKPKIGVALGAGGARGLAHIGVLKALESAGVKISFLSGSSVGALVGGAYAIYGSAAKVEEILQEFLQTDIFKKAGLSLMKEVFHEQPEGLANRLQTFVKKTYIRALLVTRDAILDNETYQEIIEHVIPDVQIEDLPLPFCTVSSDLGSGRPVRFVSGSLRNAIRASTAIPGIISPFSLDNLLLTDGGVLNMVPVLPLVDLGADVILAVDVEEAKFNEEDREFNTGVDILFRAEDMEGMVLKNMQLEVADLVIKPKVGHIFWSDFTQAAEMIQYGQDSVKNHLDQINKLATKRIRPKWLFKTPRNTCPGWPEWIEI